MQQPKTACNKCKGQMLELPSDNNQIKLLCNNCGYTRKATCEDCDHKNECYEYNPKGENYLCSWFMISLETVTIT